MSHERGQLIDTKFKEKLFFLADPNSLSFLQDCENRLSIREKKNVHKYSETDTNMANSKPSTFINEEYIFLHIIKKQFCHIKNKQFCHITKKQFCHFCHN